MIRCLIIDDEPLAIEVIKIHVSQLKELQLINTFNNPIEALETLKTEAIDLIFLDIEMPLLSGIDFLKTIPKVPKVIFTTAYRHYAIESYELDVVDYLLKPISFSNNHMYVNANKKHIKIGFDDILYIESIKDYIRIHLANSNVVTKESISNFETKLPAEFLRIHRSFIVNTSKITAFTKVDIEIETREIPIGASYKEKVITFLKGN